MYESCSINSLSPPELQLHGTPEEAFLAVKGLNKDTLFLLNTANPFRTRAWKLYGLL